MKIRFWQKTYLFTIILFLFCLYICIFSLAFYTYFQNIENAENTCSSEYQYIAKSFERDYRDLLTAGDSASPILLMQSYGTNYKEQQIYLSFSEGTQNIYTTFVKSPEAISADTLSQTKLNGDRYLLISTEICDGQYLMLYGKNINTLDQEFYTLITTYAIVAAVVSLFLAVCLLYILKKLSIPLEKLQYTTEQLSSGDMSVLADESGKDEFSVLAKSFNHMIHTIKMQMKTLSDDAKRKQMLVDNMAHEMRTPLTSIRGYAEYIEKAAIPEQERIDSARRIVSEADRLKKISEKLLDTAFIRENPLNMRSLNLSVVLSDTVEKLLPLAHNREISISTDISNTEVMGDEILLSMLFYNLTENAIKACSPGGMVTLTCHNAIIIISDNGKGMTSEQLAHITEPFYRTDKSRSRAEGGAGLGLYLCQQIAISHGVHMHFASEIDIGTTVSINFNREKTHEKNN